jgi:hypothetical protein
MDRTGVPHNCIAGRARARILDFVKLLVDYSKHLHTVAAGTFPPPTRGARFGRMAARSRARSCTRSRPKRPSRPSRALRPSASSRHSRASRPPTQPTQRIQPTQSAPADPAQAADPPRSVGDRHARIRSRPRTGPIIAPRRAPALPTPQVPRCTAALPGEPAPPLLRRPAPLRQCASTPMGLCASAPPSLHPPPLRPAVPPSAAPPSRRPASLPWQSARALRSGGRPDGAKLTPPIWSKSLTKSTICLTLASVSLRRRSEDC